MICQTCGGGVSVPRSDCETCFTPVGAPAVQPGTRTRPVRVVGLLAAAAVALTVLFEAAYAVLPLIGRKVAQQQFMSSAPDPDPLRLIVIADLLIAFGQLAVYLVAIVLVVVWCYRARKNLDAFPGSAPSISAGWAIGGWFVPFVNLVMPYRVVAEITRASLWRIRTPVPVMAWWAAWLAYLLVGQFVSRSENEAQAGLPLDGFIPDNYAAYRDYYAQESVPRLLLLLTAVIAGGTLILVIRGVASAQEARIARAVPVPVLPGAVFASGPVAVGPAAVTSGTAAVPPVVPDQGGGTIGA